MIIKLANELEEVEIGPNYEKPGISGYLKGSTLMGAKIGAGVGAGLSLMGSGGKLLSGPNKGKTMLMAAPKAALSGAAYGAGGAALGALNTPTSALASKLSRMVGKESYRDGMTQDEYNEERVRAVRDGAHKLGMAGYGLGGAGAGFLGSALGLAALRNAGRGNLNNAKLISGLAGGTVLGAGAGLLANQVATKPIVGWQESQYLR